MAKAAFTLLCDVDDSVVSFNLTRSNLPYITVSANDEGAYVGYRPTDKACRLAADLVDVDLWPAFANSLKPEYAVNTLFTV